MAKENKKISLLWNVLIAEDDLKSRAQLLRTLLSKARCVTVETGEEAIQTYQKAIKKKQPFDFILLDITMPKKDGFEVLKTIRASEEQRKETPLKCARIIMITTYKDSLMENYNMGWDEFITKPVDEKVLINKMQQLIKRRSV